MWSHHEVDLVFGFFVMTHVKRTGTISTTALMHFISNAKERMKVRKRHMQKVCIKSFIEYFAHRIALNQSVFFVSRHVCKLQ